MTATSARGQHDTLKLVRISICDTAGLDGLKCGGTMPDHMRQHFIGLLIACLALIFAPCSVSAQDSVPPATAEESVESAPEGETESQNAENATDPDAVAAAVAVIGSVFEETPWYGWLYLLGGIFLGLFCGKVAQVGLRGASARLTARGWTVRGLLFHDAASPVSLALFTSGLALGFKFGLMAPPELNALADKVFQFLYIFSLGWFFYNVVDVIDYGLKKITDSSTNKLSSQIVPLIRKTLRVFIVVVFALFIAQNVFEVNITAWLAGLGIAGLAVSLAAQDSIKNLFGSITVLLDKPFAVGDRIQFAGADGFVEEIGFRSTKLRTFTGHLVTIPNMKFIDGTVENVSARPFIRRAMDVTITYDTSSEKIDEAVQIVKGILDSPDMQEAFDMEARPPRVFFNDLNADSLNISVAYWYFLSVEKGHDWWTYMAHAQEFNRRLFRAFGEAKIDFAFPTQTLYLAGDPDRQLSLRLLQDVGPGEASGRALT